MSETSITFLRHGRSRADDEGVHEGRYDSPLTEVGRAQARARALAWLAEGVTFDQIVCSTLARARTTAEIVGEALGVAVEPDPAWMEVDNGSLAGLSPGAAAARFPEPVFRTPYDPLAEVGESAWDLHCRAARAVQKVARRPGRSLVVAHGGVLNAALRSIVGAEPPVNGAGVYFAFGDLGFVRTTYKPERHRWVIRELRPE